MVKFRLGLVGLAIACGQIFGAATAHSAEQIRFWYAPFGEFTIYVKDLEEFAQGQMPPRLANYLGRLSPQQQAQVRTALSTRYGIKPTAIASFTYSPIGEMLMRGMGRILQITPQQNGFTALRAALIFSAQSEEGLTVVKVLRQYPVPVIYLDLPQAMRTYQEFLELTDRKDAVMAAIEQQAIAETVNINSSPSSPKSNPHASHDDQDWRQMGKHSWRREKFSYWQGDRQRKVESVLYLPNVPAADQPAHLIVISHGLGANSETLRYLAEHLASHGFAIAAINHPRTNADELDAFLADLSKNLQYQEAVQRPRDVSYLIDAIATKTASDPQYRVNTQRVGLIGHSLGGYTVLALAGGRINGDQINQECGDPNTDLASVNISKILQCRMRSLDNNSANASPNSEIDLSDRRIHAVLAINPLGGRALMGRQGIAKIQIPLTIFTSGEDLLTPAIPEQVFPFVWLTHPHKYLVTFPKGTHFSFLEKVERGVVVIPANLFGEKPAFTHPYSKAWSVNFFQTHLRNRPEFATYLHNGYMQAIANPQFPVSVTTNFSESQLIQALSASP